MINPCIIIATHQRLQITTVNIKQLISQGVKVVVVSDSNEKDYYDQFDIHCIMHPNNPLGAKWQAGVTYARQFDPSHIVITGSDDLLSVGFFDKYCECYNYTGFMQWYIYNSNKLYHLEYKNWMPLGGGRIFGKQGLEARDYKLFDKNKNKFLDDYAFNDKIVHGSRWRVIYDTEILAIKGNWPVMNKVDLNHRNVKLLATYEGDEALNIMKKKFDYEP